MLVCPKTKLNLLQFSLLYKSETTDRILSLLKLLDSKEASEKLFALIFTSHANRCSLD